MSRRGSGSSSAKISGGEAGFVCLRRVLTGENSGPGSYSPAQQKTAKLPERYGWEDAIQTLSHGGLAVNETISAPGFDFIRKNSEISAAISAEMPPGKMARPACHAFAPCPYCARRMAEIVPVLGSHHVTPHAMLHSADFAPPTWRSRCRAPFNSVTVL